MTRGRPCAGSRSAAAPATRCSVPPRACGADVYLTSDLRHHRAGEHLAAGGCALVDVAHWAAEWMWLPQAARLLEQDAAAAGLTLATTVSTIVTDPWTFHVGRPLECALNRPPSCGCSTCRRWTPSSTSCAHRRRTLPQIAELADARSRRPPSCATARSRCAPQISDLERELARAEADVAQVRERIIRDRALLDTGAVASAQAADGPPARGRSR